MGGDLEVAAQQAFLLNMAEVSSRCNVCKAAMPLFTEMGASMEQLQSNIIKRRI